jgi:voltage-gated sodium channel
MGQEELQHLLQQPGLSRGRERLARWVESPFIQRLVIVVILFNAIILGLETDKALMASYGTILVALDKACLAIFVAELVLKLIAYRGLFWRSGWNLFDFAVVAIALAPAAGPFAVLRSLRVLRVLRLLTVIPSLRRVVAAFLHAIPGLIGVMAVMVIFFYVMAVLSTKLFGATFPQWFGTLGASLFTLFQIMTLEGWAMDMVRPIMDVHPHSWIFFIPFIILATFIILNLFIGVIVSTMQELALTPETKAGGDSTPDLTPAPSSDPATLELLHRLESEIRALREQIPPRPPQP